MGSLVSATGATVTAPPGVFGVQSNGTQDPGNPDRIYFIDMPAPSGPFAPSSGGGVYSAVNYNFGEFGLVNSNTSSTGGNPPVQVGIPGTSSGPSSPNGNVSASLAILGGNNRFLAGPGAGSLGVSATVSNPTAPDPARLIGRFPRHRPA